MPADCFPPLSYKPGLCLTTGINRIIAFDIFNESDDESGESCSACISTPGLLGTCHRVPMSTSLIGSRSQLGPFGSTLYNKDFCWKSACKPESICTGSASGHRRNNPHPRQSFMMWRLPRDARQSLEYVGFPCNCAPSEAEVCRAVAAQYHSIYRGDFAGMPQGYDHHNGAERRGSAAQYGSRHARISTDTEMRDNYREPKRNPELLSDRVKARGNRDPPVTCLGIVPTVVQRRIRTQQTRSDLTTYERFCGKTVTDVAPVVKSLLPPELQQLCRIPPEKDKEAVIRVLSQDSSPADAEQENKLPALNPSSPERMSRWTGPL
ncbi:testis-expressed protein 26-like isoform X3 [Betta splendens]|uniref:Testis-expressed protein 26-like isoform X3 n=1 Tax=Betta splendens TaxID=158456 RepID=A0A6P7PAF8_BETSP|nr:testis-expressed protein 26-like isoform X3 [Betta splendens]